MSNHLYKDLIGGERVPARTGKTYHIAGEGNGFSARPLRPSFGPFLNSPPFTSTAVGLHHWLTAVA